VPLSQICRLSHTESNVGRAGMLPLTRFKDLTCPTIEGVSG
jgi:hypothetical protein